jgi:hypothetical protein
MMQMLAAGGMVALTDAQRKPDADNPRGYLEWEPIKQLPKNPDLIDQANGKVVKVISQLLLSLPEGRDYKILFMDRPVSEILLSQDQMLRRRGREDFLDQKLMTEAFEEHLREIEEAFRHRTRVDFRHFEYGALLRDPIGSAQAGLNTQEMAVQVDPNLYRNRSR